MKVLSKQYAQTLYELTQGKSEDEINGVIKKFAELLKRNRQLNLLSDIAKRFSETWNKNNEVIEAEAISREELGKDLRVKIKKFVKNKYQAREVILKNKTDKKIKGGIIVRVGDEILDGSVSRRLTELRKAITR